MTTVSLRMDDKLKKELDDMCDEMGMNITTFFMIYAKRALRDRKIPFEIVAPKDPFYSKENMEHIEKSERQIEEGKVVQKTMEELEAMENEQPFDGEGKPEPLKGRNNQWSRRINEKDRLVYIISEDYIFIVQCKGHYDDK